MRIFSFIFLLCFSLQTTAAGFCVAVLDSGAGNPHEKQVTQIIRDGLKSCAGCTIKSFPIYDLKGDFSVEKMLTQIKKATKTCSVINLSWNMLLDSTLESVRNELTSTVKSGVLVVAASGEPDSKEGSRLLSSTVMGRVDGAILIGELDKKGKLPIEAYYGPELLTALNPPEGKLGSSFAAALFSARLMKAVRAKEKISLEVLQERKKKSFEMYPNLDTLFATEKPKL